jgi:hypothetical protein
VTIAGHLRTVLPRLGDALRTPPTPRAEPWSAIADGPGRPVLLSGWLRRVPDTDTLVVIVHGLGGSAETPYARRAAATAETLGASSLRLNLRGSDHRGEDFYHAGLTADLHTALASPELADYSRLYIAGVSLGGHLALRLLTEEHDPRLRAVAAVCSPLDLDATSAAFDRPQCALYRYYILRRLREIYTEVAARHPLPTPPETLRSVRRLRQFDALTVAPRFGFESAEDYYARACVGPLLGSIVKPVLFVAAEDDPMVPRSTVVPALAAAPATMDVRWVRQGGHVSVPSDLDLGVAAPAGLTGQVIGWLLER